MSIMSLRNNETVQTPQTLEPINVEAEIAKIHNHKGFPVVNGQVQSRGWGVYDYVYANSTIAPVQKEVDGKIAEIKAKADARDKEIKKAQEEAEKIQKQKEEEANQPAWYKKPFILIGNILSTVYNKICDLFNFLTCDKCKSEEVQPPEQPNEESSKVTEKKN